MQGTCRVAIVAKAVETGVWHEGWRQELLQTEAKVWGVPQEEEEGGGSPDSELEVEQVENIGAPKSTGLEAWQASVNTSIAGLGDYMQKISESLRLLAAPQPGAGKKRKSKETVPKKKASPQKRKTLPKKKVRHLSSKRGECHENFSSP